MKNKKPGAEWPRMQQSGSELLADSKVPLDMVHELYVLRLVDEGVSFETAMELIVTGILRPN